MRQKITNFEATRDVVVTMSEGNLGATTVLMELLELPSGMNSIKTLHDMNIRGEQIWVGYKDFANRYIDVFREALKTRSPELVAMVNRNSGTAEQANA